MINDYDIYKLIQYLQMNTIVTNDYNNDKWLQYLQMIMVNGCSIYKRL